MEIDVSIESYGHMVIFSKDAEKMLINMSDSEIDMCAHFLAHSIRNTEMKLMEEYEQDRI